MISGARTLQTHTVSVYKGAAVWTRLGLTASGWGGGVDLGSPVVRKLLRKQPHVRSASPGSRSSESFLQISQAHQLGDCG